jgi:glycosyltransferase involved in cell wall biosynthesis
MTGSDVAFVIPLYNESAVYSKLIERLNAIMDRADVSIKVLLIDDGSADTTPDLIAETALADSRFIGIFLSRNYGHAYALSAGLREADAQKAVMIVDGDLQDPPELFFEFYEKLKLGYDVVYAVRRKRKENFVKRIAYHLSYRFIKKVAVINLPLDSGDFSLLSRRALDALNSMPEESRYLRGMRSWVGFKQIGIPYERQGRAAGTSKYSIAMLVKLAYNGIFNFSEFPIKLIQRVGYLSILVAMIYFGVILVKKFYFDSVPEGFTSLLFIIIFFSGIQMLAVGIIGEYILRIFFQVKNRPLYIIKDIIADRKFSGRK